MSEVSGHRIYFEFVEKLLDEQGSRKSSLEQRGVAVITTSGTLVTLLFGVVALSTRSETTYTLPPAATPWLTAVIVLLTCGALFGLATNVPMRYQNMHSQDLERLVREHWNDDEWTAGARVTQTRVEILSVGKRFNSWKAALLIAGVGLEALALIPLGIAVEIVLSA